MTRIIAHDEWYETIAIDTVVAAHGGTARALIAHLGYAPPEDATRNSMSSAPVGPISRQGTSCW